MQAPKAVAARLTASESRTISSSLASKPAIRPAASATLSAIVCMGVPLQIVLPDCTFMQSVRRSRVRLQRTRALILRNQRRAANRQRSDHLLAASLIGSLQGLRDVLANALTAHAKVQTKALGDAGDDVVYTPVTPCRLVDTRNAFAAVYQGAGAFTGGEIRNYAVQGGNGVCLSQLPGGLNPSAVQLQVFGIPVNGGASGDVEILPQGSTFGSTATLVYLGNVLLTSASTTARINLANNQVGVQVRGGGANVAIDVVGYFKPPAGTVQPAAILWVAKSGGNYTSIQSAINAAAAVASATQPYLVKIAPGTYTEQVTLKD